MLKIGFDAKRLFNNFTGLGNYSRTLVQGLNQFYPDNSYFLFTPKIKKKPDTINFFDKPYNLVLPKGDNKNLWRTATCTKQIKNLKLDLYHGLSHELPIGIGKTGAKSLVTIHDLIYKTYPHDFSFIDRKIYDFKFRYACEKADKIIAVSESTKKDIELFYQIPSEKIEVVYQSCQPNFKKILNAIEIEEITKKYNLPKSYMLYVGSIIERKNLLGIVQALNKIKDQVKMPLVVVGSGGEYLKKVKNFIANNKLETRVIFTSEISFMDLPAIYQRASLFLYPSFYEGFGIPVIEAQWSCTPVITSEVSSLPEAAGKGAHYCKPADANTIAEGIVTVLQNEDYKKQLVSLGMAHVQKFEAAENSQKLMGIYKKVLGE